MHTFRVNFMRETSTVLSLRADSRTLKAPEAAQWVHGKLLTE